MRVPQEKCEQYAVYLVAAKKRATVLSQICRTTYTILHKISQMVIFSYFCIFLKICLIFGKEYILIFLHQLPEPKA